MARALLRIEGPAQHGLLSLQRQRQEDESAKSTRDKVEGTHLIGSEAGGGGGGCVQLFSETEVLADDIVPLLSSPHSQPAWHQIRALH